ncbi:Hypothetical predicted protein [Paramuricea clavata]|uniref:Uncharacterized protein n=1 Tax=Paramuricea clavata TaxID=317549 RepID=A0A6S7IA98_PARCT|nr:Hypothetical predicted protein [Paramuricea clavata]
MSSPLKRKSSVKEKKITPKKREDTVTEGNLSRSASQNTQGQVSRKKESKRLIGYVHNLSPKKRNKKDTLDYLTLTLQTEDTYQDVLCYSMAKRPLLMTSMTSRTPIKVDHFAKTTDGSKVIINDMTSVAVPNQTEYSFQYTEQEDNITFISTVIQGHDPLDIVNVRGKVVKLLPETTAGRITKRLRKGAFVDRTGVILLHLWEQNIGEVEEGKVYTITSARVGIWNGHKYLGTTRQSVITVCSGAVDVSDIHPDEIDQLLSSERDTVIEVENFDAIESVTIYKECDRCSKRIIQASSIAFLHCDQCGRSTRTSSCKTNVCAKVLVKDSEKGKNIPITLFNDVIGDLVQESNTMDSRVLAEQLLMLGRMSISFNSSTGVVSKVTLL